MTTENSELVQKRVRLTLTKEESIQIQKMIGLQRITRKRFKSC